MFHEHMILLLRRKLTARLRRPESKGKQDSKHIGRQKADENAPAEGSRDLALDKSKCLEAIYIGSVFLLSTEFLSQLSSAPPRAHPATVRMVAIPWFHGICTRRSSSRRAHYMRDFCGEQTAVANTW